MAGRQAGLSTDTEPVDLNQTGTRQAGVAGPADLNETISLANVELVERKVRGLGRGIVRGVYS
jgi:hypothetical protein